MTDANATLTLSDLLRTGSNATKHLVTLTKKLEDQSIREAGLAPEGAQLEALQSIDLLQQSLVEIAGLLARLSDVAPAQSVIDIDPIITTIKLRWLHAILVKNTPPHWAQDGAKTGGEVSLF